MLAIVLAACAANPSEAPPTPVANAAANPVAKPVAKPVPVSDLKPTVTRTGERHVTMCRRFADASCSQVFAALTTPDLLRRWLNAAGRKLTASEIDLRPGGSYRHTFTSPGRTTLVVYGAFREVVPDKRIVHTEAYEGYDWEPLVVRTDLVASGRDTVMTVVSEYPSKQICDRDMPNLENAAAAYDGLAALLAQKQKK
jgi:uncharacterized protein YndB with AHSA1/START domain